MLACVRATRRLHAKNQLRTLVTGWQKASSSINLPERESREIAVAAFYGDKILGAAVALSQQRADVDDQATVGDLTHTHMLAVSNEVLHANFADILPQYSDAVGSHRSQSRAAGTMVEAAVATVHATGPGGAAAIDDLADWLVQRAHASQLESVQDFFQKANAKGKLLELGGRVSSTRVGGPDNEPVWSAEAALGEQRVIVRVTGSSKDAERKAAEQVLNSVFSVEY